MMAFREQTYPAVLDPFRGVQRHAKACKGVQRRAKACKEKEKNYTGSKTLPATIKEKETHWPEVA
jgi:hypothetical protein